MCIFLSRVCAPQVTVYVTSPHDLSEQRRRVETGAERVVDLSGLSDGDAARAINADGVHILVDLNGYTKGARTQVFALRPAPVQIGFLGYSGTMGCPAFMQ